MFTAEPSNSYKALPNFSDPYTEIVRGPVSSSAGQPRGMVASLSSSSIRQSPGGRGQPDAEEAGNLG